ncbi:two component transcriptional regulator, winged helix family protein [Psychromonas ingrahamii 37]|uniref:Two component transcriptional regulator, winged helix family protein n=1 Tax=Psychromonas ingrahamii (strain DSM 17664 / CCUG 51855 / 37) TaxID=357804 RepID=A1SYE4_PSYIN|nr:winged helix-turn-helix domain-containing protein [Psychromonas ingrahamii]ABM04509.1 two component transcriptional regulator, winged helix family protein [Psychromonas ingrahamii 37]
MDDRSKKPILIVDDEVDVRILVSDVLNQAGYPCVAVADGNTMFGEMKKALFSLLIIDLRLKNEDGLVLARSVRENSNIPILMLTGKGSETDRILSLEIAADDFLMKPFNIRELVARVNALQRRAVMTINNDPADLSDSHECLSFGHWILDLSARELRNSSGEVTLLTYGEFTLLESLATRPKRVISREQLLEYLRGAEGDTFDRTVDVLISRLRQKLEINSRSPRYIRTERGIGYSFSENVSKSIR